MRITAVIEDHGKTGKRGQECNRGQRLHLRKYCSLGQGKTTLAQRKSGNFIWLNVCERAEASLTSLHIQC